MSATKSQKSQKINLKKQQRQLVEISGCDGCRQEPIIGKKYRCQDCDDFDFCSYCVLTMPHNNLHTFTEILE